MRRNRSAGRLLRPALRARTPPTDGTGRALMGDLPQLDLVAPAQVRVGDPVPLTLRLHNPGDHPITVAVVGRTILFDIVARREDGGVVWQRLAGQMAPAIMRLLTIAPGKALELRESWIPRGSDGRPLAPGTYVVEGAVPTDGPEPLRAAPQQVRLVP